MTQQRYRNWHSNYLILLLIWLAGAILDRIWFGFDNSVPAWDQADYLNGVMNYWEALQIPQLLNVDWWRDFWLLSSKIPPLTYIITVPFLNLWATHADAATLVMLLFSAVLLLSIYGLGTTLFNPNVGLWAAILCQLLPGLYRYRLEFLLDHPLTTIVTFSFGLLTIWYRRKNSWCNWLWAIMLGISLGMALLIKQTSLLFLFTPLVWVLVAVIKNKYWIKLAQLITSFSIAVLICYPWYRTNWLLILTSGKRATLDSAIAEGDPALNTLEAWFYYLKILPYLISIPLLIIAGIGLIIYVVRKINNEYPNADTFTWRWLSIFFVGGYLLSSLNINKDARYILPLLPTFSIVLAVGLLSWRSRWQVYIRWFTLAITALLMILNLFPLGGSTLTQILSPHVQHYPYLGQSFPHQKVITTIDNANPYLQTTLGVLPSTPEINQHNFSFYGTQPNYQVYGRQVGVRETEIEQDTRSLDWFVTKTGDQGSIPEVQKLIVQRVENSDDFYLHATWKLPDKTSLNLYHRREASVRVSESRNEQSKVQLNRIIVPENVPPGYPIPISYEWSGSWQQLASGLVLLTWKQENSDFWLHDHAIGMGRLKLTQFAPDTAQKLTVTERTAMFPAQDIQPGDYTLEATYLNRETGETYAISTPSITLKIDPAAAPKPAPELDLVTQFRRVSAGLPEGIEGLEPVFIQTARINQYDPNQDYVVQAEKILSYRLKQQPERLDWAYTLALARVLQQDVKGAIASFQEIRERDTQNPYAHAYLAFVYLYNWQPYAAQAALEPALRLAPNVPEFKVLSGIAALMQGNLIKAWHNLSPLLSNQ